MYINIVTETNNFLIEAEFDIIVYAPKRFAWMIGQTTDYVYNYFNKRNILIKWQKVF
jgi:hypothetical protein